MPQKPNTPLRIIVPLVIFAVGALLAVAIFRNTVARQGQGQGQQAAPQQPAASGQQPSAPSAPSQSIAEGESSGAQPSTGSSQEEQAATSGGSDAEQAAPAGPQTPGAGAPPAPPAPLPAAAVGPLHPRVVPAQTFDPIGSPDPDGEYELFVQFSPQDAGVKRLLLAKQFETVQKKDQEVLQEAVQPTGGFVAPFGAVAVEIGGTGVGVGFTAMQAAGGPVWEQIEPGHFRATIVNENDEPVLEITRRFVVQKGSFDLRLEQKLTNLTDGPLPVRWYQWGPVDLPQGFIGYGGDKRRLRFGYLRSPTSTVVETSDGAPGFYSRRSVVHKGEPDRSVWPNEASSKYNFVLSWAALTNRYYALAMHPWVDPASLAPGDLVLSAVERVDRYLVGTQAKPIDKTIILRTVSPEMTIAPGASADASLGVYAGPLSTQYMSPASEPVAAAVQLEKIIIYTFGGACSFYTFQWLAVPMRVYLGFLDQYVVFDWALAIIVLVITVRSLLHPITRFSQIRLHKFGKQMQALGPKMAKIKERFPNDPKKQQEEMQRLYREEGLNPAHALGCLPLVLQSPIWIALYAMLFFTFEMRHESAFFGLFQLIHIHGKPWTFLADLAEPDRFIYFGRTVFTAPFLGPITSLNILPLIYAGVFFVHQKFLTPPTAATLSSDQESAQKLAKYMPLVLFPLFIYNAPSGLAVYFICNSIIAIVESKLIRKKADKMMEEEAKNPPKRKAKAKSSEGFMSRVMRLAEERRKLMEEAQRTGNLNRGGRGPGGGRNGGRGGRGRKP